MGHESLANYYKTNFSLMQHHKYSIAELEEMIPFERDVYILLLSQHIEKENERIKMENSQQQAQMRRRR
ncbi:MAG: hypothetical protein EBU93_04845 [Chlamydiae bacterium]|nr:hypothetical protein [Chlamydiota bacterium]